MTVPAVSDGTENGQPHSIGSVIGRLESTTVHGALKAGLWVALGGHRVEVQFARDQKDAVQNALDKRVEVSGFLTRDANNRPVSIKMRRIELLPEEDVPLSEIAGVDPNLTGGLESAFREHMPVMSQCDRMDL